MWKYSSICLPTEIVDVRIDDVEWNPQVVDGKVVNAESWMCHLFTIYNIPVHGLFYKFLYTNIPND